MNSNKSIELFLALGVAATISFSGSLTANAEIESSITPANFALLAQGGEGG